MTSITKITVGRKYLIATAILVFFLMAIPFSANEVEAKWGKHELDDGNNTTDIIEEESIQSSSQFTYPAGDYSSYHYFLDFSVDAGDYNRSAGEMASVNINFTEHMLQDTLYIPSIRVVGLGVNDTPLQEVP